MNARHIFKPGDKAYWVKHNQWVTLKEFTHRDYPLTIEEGEGGFTPDGRFICGGDIVLLPINPYDPTDPNNPPEFRNPFLHEGRLVKIGDDMANKITGRYLGEVFKMMVEPPSRSYLFIVGPNGGNTWEVGNKDLTFSDSLPKKKITYLWAIPVFGISGSMTVDFKRMTQEEGERYWKAKIVPDSEKEES